jgi:hypothetical protein
MKDELFYDAIVADSVKTRREINEVHWAKMNDLSKRFQDLTGLNHKDFQLAKNAIYYQGGWPSPNTKPRVETAVANFAQLCRVLQYLGRDQQLKECFEQFGLKVEVTPIASTPTPMVQTIMDEAVALQRVICQMADSIKIDAADKIEKNCEVLKPHFLTNVKILAKKGKGSKIERDVEAFQLTTESATSIVEKIKVLA